MIRIEAVIEGLEILAIQTADMVDGLSVIILCQPLGRIGSMRIPVGDLGIAPDAEKTVQQFRKVFIDPFQVPDMVETPAVSRQERHLRGPVGAAIEIALLQPCEEFRKTGRLLVRG